MRKLFAFALVAVAMVGAWHACQLMPTDETKTRIIQHVASTHLSLVGETGGGDSLLVEVGFDTISDPSGIDRVHWQNWGVAPPEITADTVAGMTKTMIDTLKVRKPPINSADTYNLRVHAVDKVENQGPWSPPHEWTIMHGDTTGPFPPGIVLEDTIKIYTSVTILSVTVWPSSIRTTAYNADGNCYAADTSPPCAFPALAISLYDDGGVLCTDGLANQDTGDGDRDRTTPAPWSDPNCYVGAEALGADPDHWAGRRYSFVDWSIGNDDPTDPYVCETTYYGAIACRDTVPDAPPAASVYLSKDRMAAPLRLSRAGASRPEPGSWEFYHATR